MHYRRLGETGLVVSEIGVGGAGLGHRWGTTSDEEAIATVRAALAAGVNFFDVAPRYGKGRAERNVGRGLEGQRERAVVASKVFLSPEQLDDVAGSVERSLAQTLEDLGTDHLDLYQLHNQITMARGSMALSLSLEDVLGPRGVVETLQRLREEGAVRFIGCTGLGEAEAVRAVIGEGGLNTVQAYYNLLNRSAAEPLPPGSGLHDHGQIIPLAASHGLGVIVIRNLAGGVLSGEGLDRAVGADSLFARDAERGSRLGFLRRDDASLSQVATRFVLQQREVSTVAPGVKNAAEMADAIAAAEIEPLEGAALSRLDEEAADDFGVREPSPVTL